MKRRAGESVGGESAADQLAGGKCSLGRRGREGQSCQAGSSVGPVAEGETEVVFSGMAGGHLNQQLGVGAIGIGLGSAGECLGGFLVGVHVGDFVVWPRLTGGEVRDQEVEGCADAADARRRIVTCGGCAG